MQTQLMTRSSVVQIGRDVVRATEKAATKLDMYLNTKRHKPKVDIAQNITNPYVLGFLEDYLAADSAQNRGEWLAGEVYWLYFRAPETTQQAFVAALCRRHRTEVPSLDSSPRQRLIVALYGNIPGDLDIRNGHDSPAGKRVSAAIRRFEDRAGLRLHERKERVKEYLPRRTREFLAKLYAEAKPDEQAVVNRLIARVYGKKAVPSQEIAA